MGYPVPTNSPQFTVNGSTYCIAAFDWDNPIGRGYYAGVFIKMQDGSWNSISTPGNGVVKQYMNPGEVLADMQAKGGRVKYLQWLITRFNDILSAFFNAEPPPPILGEPKTDQEARDIITAAVPTFRVTMVNGVPVVG
jgi:hypothetical protein